MMRESSLKKKRFLLTFLSVFLTVTLIIACNRNHAFVKEVSSPAIPSTNSSSTTVRVVKHAMGELQVPANPSRVITLTAPDLGNAVALGIKPIGTVAWDLNQQGLKYIESYLGNEVDEIAYLGSPGQPNLEKILSLKPDLIISQIIHRTIYSQLSKIAPTFLHDVYYDQWGWKKVLKSSGEALNRTQEVEVLLSNYQQRVESLKQKLANQGSKPTVSLIYADQSSMSFLLKDSFAGRILQDIGLPRPPLQDKPGTYSQAMSFELIPQLDGDVIFLIPYGDSDSLDYLEQLQQHPLWSRLRAVQQGKIYQVSAELWLSEHIIAANQILDDLFKYLLDEE
jgi:iron complex transport system substrate-binding protein